MFWVHIRGQHPQTGADLDMPDCAVRWLPTLLIEGTQQTRQAGAAIESFRNEMVSQNRQLAAGIVRALPIAEDH